jgi:hypothetical protein
MGNLSWVTPIWVVALRAPSHERRDAAPPLWPQRHVPKPQCPSSMASGAQEIPARTRTVAVFSMPSFVAMVSAILKPMPIGKILVWKSGR